MAKRQSIKQHQKMLKKYMEKQSPVKIYRTILGENQNLFGFILDMSSDFLLLHLIDDFAFDGYAIIRKFNYDSIRHNKYDKTTKMILQGEGVFEQLGIEQKINLESWKEALLDLKRYDYHVIVESQKKKSVGFHIGPIINVGQKKVEIHYYDPTGKFDEKTSKIKLDQMTSIMFGDNYSTIFRKYLKII